MIIRIKNRFIPNTGLVIISFLFCLVFLFLTSLGKTEDETEEELDFIEKPDIEYTASEFRDPFQPQVSMGVPEISAEEESGRPKPSEILSLSIQGIIWNSDIPLVIINNEVLGKGESLLIPKGKDVTEKVTIMDIGKDGVTIIYLGEAERLPSPATLDFKRIKGGKNEYQKHKPETEDFSLPLEFLPMER